MTLLNLRHRCQNVRVRAVPQRIFISITQVLTGYDGSIFYFYFPYLETSFTFSSTFPISVDFIFEGY